MDESNSLLHVGVIKQVNYEWNGCMILLWLETMEAVVLYGISQALKNFMESKLGYLKTTASAIQSTWRSFYDITPLLGAYIGDEIYGRKKTILFFSIWYLLSISILTIASHPYILIHYNSFSNVLFLISLFFGVGIAHGCFNPNIVTFGADQFPSQEKEKQLFFSSFYLAINIGSSLSYGYLTYLSINGAGTWIPSSFGYFATFLISGVLFFIALVLYVLNLSRFIVVLPQKGAFTQLFKIITMAMHNVPDLRYIFAGFILFVLSFIVNCIAVFSSGEIGSIATYLAGFLVLSGMGCWIAKGMDPSYLDHVDILPLDSINELKQVLRVLPFATFLVLWQCVFDQIDANFQSIVQQCDLRLGMDRDSPQIPGAMLGLFDTIGVSIVIPLLEFIIFPRLEKYRQVSASPFEKVFIGLLLAGFAMFWTGIVETWRRQSGEIHLNDGLGPVLDLGTHKPMNNLSWIYMIPNYLLVCICECLVNVTMYDVFYSNVPLHLKSTAQAINSFMLAMGDNMASIFTLTFAFYIPDNLNQGHLEYMYYCVGIVSILNAFGFFHVMKRMNFGMQ